MCKKFIFMSWVECGHLLKVDVITQLVILFVACVKSKWSNRISKCSQWNYKTIVIYLWHAIGKKFWISFKIISSFQHFNRKNIGIKESFSSQNQYTVSRTLFFAYSCTYFQKFVLLWNSIGIIQQSVLASVRNNSIK